MNSLYKWLVSIVILVLMPVFANAAIPEWEIIPGESHLSFIAIQNDAPVKGQFKEFTGKIFVDPTDYKTSQIEIIVDMNSVSADYADVKNTLITPDFFNVKVFPKAEFKATNFNKTGDKTYQAVGTLTIRDKSAPVTLTFTAEETSPGMALVEGSTTFKRSTFGVGQGDWASTDEIKDEVKVDFKLVAKKKS